MAIQITKSVAGTSYRNLFVDAGDIGGYFFVTDALAGYAVPVGTSSGAALIKKRIKIANTLTTFSFPASVSIALPLAGYVRGPLKGCAVDPSTNILYILTKNTDNSVHLQKIA